MNSPTDLATLSAPKEASLAPVRAGFFDLASFELIQRVSKAFSGSDLVPKQYQGNLANCMIAMDMAQRIGANPLMVMQNLYIVHGTPGWSSKFLIATINACGRYSSLRYEWKGKPGEPGYGCRAWAIERETGERLDGIWVTWEMVRAEGWDSKNGSKWKTMPDQMFVYRCASFWQRAYAPELGMGLQTTDDIHDVLDAGLGDDGRYSVDIDSLRASEKVDKETGEITPPEQIKQKQPVTVPQDIDQPAATWRPNPAEEEAMLAELVADEKKPAEQHNARPRRERGGLGLE